MYGYNYYQPMDNLNQLKAQQQSSPIWVQGEAAAKSYPVAPGSTVLLMDSEQSRFFMKTTDQSGMPLPLRIFEFKEVAQNAPISTPSVDTSKFVTKDELSEILANLPTCKCRKKKEDVEDESAV